MVFIRQRLSGSRGSAGGDDLCSAAAPPQPVERPHPPALLSPALGKIGQGAGWGDCSGSPRVDAGVRSGHSERWAARVPAEQCPGSHCAEGAEAGS